MNNPNELEKLSESFRALNGNYELRFFESENGAVIQTISFTVG